MSSTSSLIWPKGQNDQVVQLINLYLSLVDSKDPSAGPRLADQVFAKDAKWFAAAGCFEGHGRYLPPDRDADGNLLLTARPTDSIAGSRAKAWDTVNSQKHKLLKVFINDASDDGLDLLIAGVAKVDLKGPEPVTREVEFLVRTVIIYEAGEPRIKFWQPVLAKPSSSDQPILAQVDL
jgi:hypothetical protein